MYSRLIAMALVMTFGVAAEDWPQWRGPRGDGTWRGPTLPDKWPDEGLKTVWRQAIGGGYAGVSIAGGRVYTLDLQEDNERVLCFDAATGKPVWQHVYRADYRDLTYNNGPRAAPTIHDGRVYTLGAVGHGFCLDAATGDAIWSIDSMGDFNSVRPKWGFAASPVIYGELVIYHIGAAPGGCLVAFSRSTGKEVWRAGDAPAGYCTPIIIHHDQHEQLICWNPKRLISVAPNTGKVNWTVDYPIQNGVSIATPIFADGLIFVSSYWHGAKAVRPADGSIAWEKPLLRGLMSQPLYRDGHAYMLDRKSGVVCFNMTTGERLWDDEEPRMTKRERDPQASMVWLGNGPRAIVLNALGELILARFTPKGYTEQSRTSIIGETWAHPALADRFIYARDDHELICVTLTAAPGGN